MTICADCKTPINPKRLWVHGGKPYCVECFVAYRLNETAEESCKRLGHDIDADGCRSCGLTAHRLPDAIERAERGVR